MATNPDRDLEREYELADELNMRELRSILGERDQFISYRLR